MRPSSCLSFLLFLLKRMDCSNWDSSKCGWLYLLETLLRNLVLLNRSIYLIYLGVIRIRLCFYRTEIREGLWTGSSFEWVLSWEFNWADSKRPLRNPFLAYQQKYVANSTHTNLLLRLHSIILQISQQLLASRLRRRPINQSLGIDSQLILLFIGFGECHDPIGKFQEVVELSIGFFHLGILNGKILFVDRFPFRSFTEERIIIEKGKFNIDIIHGYEWI